ncbi:MAG: hypothetical protein DRP15_03350 [Candidatus Aenigmatarchaeota archaeon]|nr:MAG: hypothetical protein DRP15_03350 [Candidatus Aenigmarchaeota archaeon]
MNSERIGYWCGVLGIIIGTTSVAIAIVISPWFSFTDNWLSDLGVRYPEAVFFNTGLILAGLLGSIFSLFFVKNMTGYILFVSTVSLMGVGLFPETTGPLHFYSSVMFFVSSILSMLLTGIKKDYHLKYIFVALAVISIAAWLPFVDLGRGAIREIVSSLCFSVFVLLLIYSLRK